MDLFRRATKATKSPQLPTGAAADEKRWSAKQKGFGARLAFLRRPLRLRGNSSVTVPLGAVILFPILVVVLILILLVRHPEAPARILIPAGAPPAIR